MSRRTELLRVRGPRGTAVSLIMWDEVLNCKLGVCLFTNLLVEHDIEGLRFGSGLWQELCVLKLYRK